MTPEVVSTGKAAGLWLVFGALLLAVVLPVHGPTRADLSLQMTHISDAHGQWAAVHWAAFVSLIALTGAGFMFFHEAVSKRGGGTPPWAWMIFALGALITVGTAVTEATGVSAAAAAEILRRSSFGGIYPADLAMDLFW